MTGALHVIAGKIAAGKSTLANKLGVETGGLVVSEDFWMVTLHPQRIISIDDYRRESERLRDALAPMLVDLLGRGITLVLDFPANTVASRTWMRGIADAAGITATLHFLDPPDDVCLARLHARNAAGTHEYAPTDEDFALFTSYFVPPTEAEGFTIVRYDQAA